MIDIRPETGSEEVWLLSVQAVPGAKRDAIAGILGDRLKIRVSAPPEGGKANRAICAQLARSLGVRENAVSVVAGGSSRKKTLRVEGVCRAQIEQLVSLASRDL